MSTGGRERWLWFSVFLLYLQVMSLFVVGGSGGVVWEHSRSSSMCHISTEKSMQSVLEENPFLRNCSEEEKHPPFLPTPSDIEALGHVLHNRTVAFIGDSTIQSQYEYLCLKLKGKNTRKKWRHPKDYFFVPSQCPLPHLGANTLLTYEGAGQRFDWARLPSASITLNKTMHRLKSKDVVLFNVGIHWNAGCRQGTDTGMKYANLIGEFQNVLSQAEHCKVKRGLQRRQGDTNVPVMSDEAWRITTSEKRAMLKYPLLIWRETLPQHFPSSNGGYPLYQQFVGDLVGLKPGEKLQCAEMTPIRSIGRGLEKYDTCNPNCLPSTWQNDLANPVMLKHCVDIMYTYEDFRCLHNHHSGEDNWDCSHYKVELVHYLNWKLLKMIGRLSKRRRSSRKRSTGGKYIGNDLN